MKKVEKRKNPNRPFQLRGRSGHSQYILGFSLTELAIVMGVIGIILSGIWALISQGWETSRREQAFEEIQTTVANVRGFYGGQAGVPNSGYPTLSSNLLAQGTIPGYLQRSGGGCTNPSSLCADNPWGANSSAGTIDAGGTFRVCNWTTLGTTTACPNSSAASTTQFFGVSLTGLPSAACSAIVMRISGPLAPTNLVEIDINGYNMAANGQPIQPANLTNVVAQCTDNAVVTFVYKIASS